MPAKFFIIISEVVKIYLNFKKNSLTKCALTINGTLVIGRILIVIKSQNANVPQIARMLGSGLQTSLSRIGSLVGYRLLW